jgi:hypothetical protein
MFLIGFFIFEIWDYNSGYKYLFLVLAPLITGRLLQTNIQLKRLRQKLNKNE